MGFHSIILFLLLEIGSSPVDDCGHSKVPLLLKTVSNSLNDKTIFIGDENQNQNFLNQNAVSMNEVDANNSNVIEIAEDAIEEMHEYGMTEGESIMSEEVSAAVEDLDAELSSLFKPGITSDSLSPTLEEPVRVEESKPTIVEKVDNCIIC